MQKLFVISAIALAMAGCASEPSTAELMRNEAKSLQAKVDLQKSLARDLEKGKKLIADGQESITEGNELVEKGNNKVAEGSKLVEEAKRIYKEQFPESQIELK